MDQVHEVDTGDVTLSCLVAGEGPVVIALHGFPDCRETFRPLLPALTGAGYRVVAPALRGYRPSEVARSGRHDALRAAEDVIYLANRYSPDEPVALIGHDWGAVIGFLATAFAPERFSRFASLAVPHPAALLRGLTSAAQLRRSWYMGLFQVPRIAEARLTRGDLALVDELWRDWSPGYRPSAEEMEEVKAAIRGREKEVIAYYRALLSPGTLLSAKPVFEKTRVRSIHLHGVDDGCIGVECSDGAERHYASEYACHRIPGAGHFLTREKPDAVAALLLSFLAP